MTEQHTSFATFIVRLSRDDEGQVHGIVERASTGLKRPVEDVANVGSVIAVMLNAESGGAKSMNASVGARSLVQAIARSAPPRRYPSVQSSAVLLAYRC